MKTILLLFLVTVTTGWGCGPKWSEPRSHFPFLDEQGRLSIWISAGSVHLGDQTVPIRMHFRPSQPGGLLGQGWSIPIIESTLYQYDENIFCQVAPDGWTRNFIRDRRNPNVIKSRSGWVGDIADGEIVIYSECGWRMTYKNGRLSRFSLPSGTIFNVIFSENRPVGLSCNGETLFKVTSGLRENLKLTTKDDGDFLLKMVQRPIVQQIGGSRIVSKAVSSLGTISNAERILVDCQFTVTPELLPQLTLSLLEKNTNSIAWDPINFVVVQNNEDIYKIVKTDSDITITRKPLRSENRQFPTETWRHNWIKGVVAISLGNHYYYEIEKFNSGANAGAIRRTSEIIDGFEKEIKYIYSEIGDVIRRSIRETEKDRSVNEYFETPERFVLTLGQKAVEDPESLREALSQFNESSKLDVGSGILSAEIGSQEIHYQFNKTDGSFRPLDN